MKNPDVRILETTTLAHDWHELSKITFELKNRQGIWQRQSRESYALGNGAVILLYNPSLKTVILTRQFRIPTYLNGNDTGLLIEACAGKLDGDEDPETAIIRETEEETGYAIRKPQKVFELYSSPGAVNEILSYFIAEYSEKDKTGAGGGLAHESEDIEVLEIKLHTALEMMKNGQIKDAKTVILLQYLALHLISPVRPSA